jgi:hypothetical protein
MAVALDVAGTEIDSTPGGTSPATYTGLTTSGSLSNGAIVAMVFMGNKTITSGTMTVTWGSQSMTFIPGTQVTSSGGFGIITFWGLVGVTVFGNQTLTVSWTGGTNNNNFACCACSWTGVNQTGGATSFPNGNTAGATSAAPAVTITSATGDAVMAAFADLAAAFTATNNTNLFLDSNMTNINCAGLRAAGAASVSCTGTIGVSDTWIASGTDIAAFVAASSFGAQVGHPPRGFLPMQKFNWGLRPTQAFPGPPAPPFLPMMPDVAIPTRKRQWLDYQFPEIYPTFAPTPSASALAMPDMAVASKKRQWINFDNVPLLYPTLAPTPSTETFSMPDVSVASKKRQWINFDSLPLFYPTLAPTPSTWPWAMPDMAVATKKRQWINFDNLALLYPTLAATPSYVIQTMPDMSIATKKQHWIDAALALAQVTAVVVAPPVVLAMPDVSIAGKKQQWLDLFLPIYGPLPLTPQTSAFPMPDMSVPSVKRQWFDIIEVPPLPLISLGVPGFPDRAIASKKEAWLELSIPLLITSAVTPTPSTFFDMRWLDMPKPQRQQWLDLFLPIYGPLPPTPNTAAFTMPDMSVKSRSLQWLDYELALFPSAATTTPAIAIGNLPDVAIASRRQQWLDLFLPVYGPLPPTSSFAVGNLPDVAIASKRQQWLDLFLPIYGPLPATPSIASFVMPDMAIKTHQRQWLDYEFPVIPVPPTLTPSTFFDTRWLDMPAPQSFKAQLGGRFQGLIGLQTTTAPVTSPDGNWIVYMRRRKRRR